MTRLFYNGIVVASVLLFAACTVPAGGFKFAQIHYSQLGACKHVQFPDGSTVDAPASRAIVLFRINTVDNTAPPVSWNFDPRLLQVNSQSDPQSNLGGDSPPVPIPANTNVSINRPVGIMVDTARPDGTDAATYKYTLLYPNVPPAPGTLGVNDTLASPGFPFNPNCTSLLGG
ncbi:hypothetical protein QN362_04470 [Actimicrobium sp. CCC2.4]|uniref:hypothetical protein n=1 Tax=Actimicrobium sp. CCC2.4 TaxID=3048606 RepID=UPI002AC997F5|nr:hypothetical protein [Actimicrobium sp. CCC2.4]MEB0134581.1 hypothetical protein [Actimicrobium sp. CCC2.4]WPX34023.1 hypothetical protein RHM62_09550 [Actimicrobium sp. CCC2.4]